MCSRSAGLASELSILLIGSPMKLKRVNAMSATKSMTSTDWASRRMMNTNIVQSSTPVYIELCIDGHTRMHPPGKRPDEVQREQYTGVVGRRGTTAQVVQ